MGEEPRTLKLPLPSYPWRFSWAYFAFYGAAVTVAAFALEELDRTARIVVCSIGALPLVLAYPFHLVVMCVARVRNYPALYRSFERLSKSLATSRRHLGERIEEQGRRGLEPLKVRWYEDRQEIFVLFKKRGGKSLPVGQALLFFDQSEQKPLAELFIIEIKSEGYLTKVDGMVDPLWEGYVRQRDESELPPPPYTAAYVRPFREALEDDGHDE